MSSVIVLLGVVLCVASSRVSGALYCMQLWAFDDTIPVTVMQTLIQKFCLIFVV